MRTRVIVSIGPARSGKTWQLLREYRAGLRRARSSPPPVGASGPTSSFPFSPSLWVSPTSRSAGEVRREFVGGELEACLSPGVFTFHKLADQILAKSASPLRPLAPVGERELLRRVVGDSFERDELAYFASAARRATFIDLLVEHIRELKRHDVSSSDYAKARPPGSDRTAQLELSRLYHRYECLLEAGALYDGEGSPLVARDLLAANPAAWPQSLALIVVDGFTDFTRGQLAFLAELAKRAARLCITLPGDRSNRADLFAKTSASLALLRRVFPQLAVERLDARATRWPAIDHLGAHLFRNPRQVPKFIAPHDNASARPPGASSNRQSLEIIAAASTHDEFRQVARRVKQRLLGGARPSEIVVAFRQLRDASHRVREVFTEFGIPFALESRARLIRATIIRSLIALLRLDDEDWPYRRIVATLTNNALHALDGPSRAAGDRLIRDLQIASGRELLLARVRELAADCEAWERDNPGAEQAADSALEYGDSLDAELPIARTPALARSPDSAQVASAPLESSDEPASTPSGATSDHYVRRMKAAHAALPMLEFLAEVLRALPTAATLTEWIDALEQLGTSLKLAPLGAPSATTPSVDEQAWHALGKHILAIAQLDRCLGSPPRVFTRGELLALLVDIASHESLPPLHDDVGRVRVLSVATARNISAKHIFLAGMSEQAFPSPEPPGLLCSRSDYEFFTNVAHQPAARSSGDQDAIPTTTRAHDEMLLFYEIVTRANQSLSISYPALDDKAQDLPASPYVGEIERTLGKEHIHYAQPHLSPIPASLPPYCVADWRVQGVNRALGNDPALLAAFCAAPETSRAASSLVAGLSVVDARSRRDSFSPFEGMLTSPAVRAKLAARFGSKHLWSPSQWETYATCPYRFFMSTVLQLQPLGELTLATNFARRGSLLHRVLHAFHRNLHSEFGAAYSIARLDRGLLVERFQAALEQAMSEFDTSGIEAALLELDHRQIVRWRDPYFENCEKYERALVGYDQLPTPTHFELRFGPSRRREEDEDPNSIDQAFVLAIGNEKIRIAGRIDRIDVGRAGDKTIFNVIDYKSGKRPKFNPEKAESGEQLQPPLYVMAAQALLFGEERSTPVWAGYWSMNNGVTIGAKQSLVCSTDGQETTDEWRSLKDKVTHRVGTLVAAIRHGDFPVHSRDDNCTGCCEYNRICRIAQIRSLEKQRPEVVPEPTSTPPTSAPG